MDRMSTYENSIYYTAGDANRPGELTRDSTLAGSVAAAPKATATALPVVSRTSICTLAAEGLAALAPIVHDIMIS